MMERINKLLAWAGMMVASVVAATVLHVKAQDPTPTPIPGNAPTAAQVRAAAGQIADMTALVKTRIATVNAARKQIEGIADAQDGVLVPLLLAQDADELGFALSQAQPRLYELSVTLDGEVATALAELEAARQAGLATISPLLAGYTPPTEPTGS